MSFLQSLFGGGSRELIGLDISSSAVKLLEFSRAGEGYLVQACAVEPLPPDVVADRQINDPKRVGEAIARAVHRAGTRCRCAAVAVAGSSVISKTIAMPAALGDGDMEEQIKAEADQYIPYSIDEVNLDFQVLGVSGKDPALVEVQLAACRKEQVEQRVAAVEIAGLTPTIVDIEAYALENACRLLYPQMPDEGRGRTVALLDIGASMTSLLVLHDRAPVYARESSFGGRALTEDIMRAYGLSFEEAVRAQRLGGLPESYRGELLTGFINDLAVQIDRALQFFFSASAAHRSVDALILAGGCANIDGLEGAIGERLGFHTRVARPFARMAPGPRVRANQLVQDEATMLIAAGLALRAFDELAA